jgi:NADH dehydrogenase [ubiquinone] 1 alpha subcomplex assembly factor 7
LRAAQQEALARVGGEATWHDRFDAIEPAPSLIVANEFFDCLPVRQFVRTSETDGAPGWRERLVGVDGEALAFGLAPQTSPSAALIPPNLHGAEEGAIAEIAPALPAWIDMIAARLVHAAGRVLIIDYGGDGTGDTLQAVRTHGKVDPLDRPGTADLTAHVDFSAAERHARRAGLDVRGPVPQGDWLRALGVEARARSLSSARPDRAERITREVDRLTGPDQMGVLFQTLCLSSPHLPPPAGF